MIDSLTVGRIARTLLLILIGFATLEVCARMQDAVTYGVPMWALHYVAPTLYAYDARGPHGIPYAHDRQFRMNALGFRGPDLRAADVSIVCLGASETFGLTDAEGQEFPRQLEVRLNAFGSERYQVVNAAFPGERLEYTLATLPGILRRVRPTYAVLYPSTFNVFWTPQRWRELYPNPAALDPPTEQWGALRIRARLRTLVRGALMPGLASWLSRRAGTERNRQPSVQPTSHLPEANIAAFRDALDQAMTTLRAAGVRPVLVTHATRYGPNDSYDDEAQLTAFVTFYPMLTKEGLFDAERRMNAVIRNEARRFDVPLVDAANLIPPGPVDFFDSFHFTDAGSARMASLLTDEIRSLQTRSNRSSTRSVAVKGTSSSRE
jgi:hypothetical protein